MKEPLPLRYTEQNHDPTPRVAHRNKRPYRLLPINSLDRWTLWTKKRIINPSTAASIRLPTNCSDLSKLGYTLSGFYLVQSLINTANDGCLKTKTVYCIFKQLEGVTFNPNAITEKRIIKSSRLDPYRLEQEYTSTLLDGTMGFKMKSR